MTFARSATAKHIFKAERHSCRTLAYSFQNTAKILDVVLQCHSRVLLPLVFNLKKPTVTEPFQFFDNRLNLEDASIERRARVALPIICIEEAAGLLTWCEGPKVLDVGMGGIRVHLTQRRKRIFADKKRCGNVIDEPEIRRIHARADITAIGASPHERTGRRVIAVL